MLKFWFERPQVFEIIILSNTYLSYTIWQWNDWTAGTNSWSTDTILSIQSSRSFREGKFEYRSCSSTNIEMWMIIDALDTDMNIFSIVMGSLQMFVEFGPTLKQTSN